MSNAHYNYQKVYTIYITQEKKSWGSKSYVPEITIYVLVRGFITKQHIQTHGASLLV